MKNKEVVKALYTCPECKSRKVLVKAWVSPNTERISDYFIDDIQDMWCEKCQEHVELNSKLIIVKKR